MNMGWIVVIAKNLYDTAISTEYLSQSEDLPAMQKSVL